MQEQHFSQAISKNLNFEVERGQELKYIDFQLQDQHSSSTESMGKASSQDQCASSDSGNEFDLAYPNP